jgi:hypothetical protein
MPGLKSIGDLIDFYITQRVTGFAVPREPHFDDPTRARFDHELQSARLFLEFGSGGSTLAASSLGVRTVSVESDAFYAKAVRRALGEHSTAIVLDASIGLTRQWGRPIMKFRTTARLQRWKSYVERPWPIIEQVGLFPDLVLVDGRFRRACALETARRAIEANQSTLMIFDDYFKPENKNYRSVESVLGEPERAGRSAIFNVCANSVERTPTFGEVTRAIRDPE